MPAAVAATPVAAARPMAARRWCSWSSASCLSGSAGDRSLKTRGWKGGSLGQDVERDAERDARTDRRAGRAGHLVRLPVLEQLPSPHLERIATRHPSLPQRFPRVLRSIAEVPTRKAAVKLDAPLEVVRRGGRVRVQDGLWAGRVSYSDEVERAARELLEGDAADASARHRRRDWRSWPVRGT